MSELMQARADITKKLHVMVRKIEGVTTFLLTGEKECPVKDIHFVAGAAAAELSRIYADLHFLTTEFLKPSAAEKAEEDGRIIANYTFDSGLHAEIFICRENNLPAFDWWVPYMDQNGAAEIFYADADKKNADPTTDEPEEMVADNPEDDFGDSLADDFDDTAAEPPVTAPQAQTQEQTQEQAENGNPWEFVYGKVNIAKHAIAGGSLIYAGEIIGELRSLLIRLICEKNGITEDYLHSIDLLSGNYGDTLAKTYPARLEPTPLVAALAAELVLFENLLK